MQVSSVSGQSILEVDIGNTGLKWRLLSDGNVVQRGRSETLAADEAWLGEIACWSSLNSVWVACVAGEPRIERLRASIARVAPQLEFRVARVQASWAGLRFAYAQIERLGVDRALAMVAAWHRVQGGVMVVDAGSAITIDLVQQGGEHLGGYILPGLPLLRTVLARGTAQLPAVSDVAEEALPGASTQACIEAGLGLLLAGLAQQLERIAAQHGIACLVFAGGDGERLMRRVGLQAEYCPDLVFEGLQYVCT